MVLFAIKKRTRTKDHVVLQPRSLWDIARADEGWLEARHHFVIGRYRNPGWQGVCIVLFTSFFHERNRPTGS
jgi:hypothetical protein